MHLSRDDFAAWLGRYVGAWRSNDPADIGDLFSEDVTYSYRAGRSVVNGRSAVVESWLESPDDPDDWDAHYEPLAIEQQVHVAIGWSRYLHKDGSVRDEYSNIFVCRFDDEGRCREFTEWWIKISDEG